MVLIEAGSGIDKDIAVGLEDFINDPEFVNEVPLKHRLKFFVLRIFDYKQ